MRRRPAILCSAGDAGRASVSLLKHQPVEVERSPEGLAAWVYRLVPPVAQQMTSLPADVGIPLEHSPEPQVVSVSRLEGDA
jgi:hypothetical protein